MAPHQSYFDEYPSGTGNTILINTRIAHIKVLHIKPIEVELFETRTIKL
jgi:hypothetical protein